MKKFISLIFVSLMFLCSCDFVTMGYDISIYDTDDIPYVEDTTKTKYIMSVHGSTYHLESCYIVKNMNEENRREFYGKDFFIERDITPCKRCKP